jgi:lipopolysaccharide transport system ATP-binding protein
MEALRDKGVTILMVTHATGSVLEYADRCIVLDGGRVIQDTRDVLAAVLAYEKGMLSQLAKQSAEMPGARHQASSVGELRVIQAGTRNVALGEKRFGTARAIIDSLSLVKADGKSLDIEPMIRSGEELVFRFRLLAAEAIDNVALGISLSKTQGGDVWGDNNLNAGVTINLRPGDQTVEYRARLPISAGEYLVHCGLACFVADQREELDQRRPTAKLNVWAPRAQVGVVYAPIQVALPEDDSP